MAYSQKWEFVSTHSGTGSKSYKNLGSQYLIRPNYHMRG